MSPDWLRTTWNSWMRSRFSACESRSRSASPRVPTSENVRRRWPSAKSSHAAMNSRLCVARSSSESRRQAGSILRNVYLTKWRRGTSLRLPAGSLARVRVALVSPYSWTVPGGVSRPVGGLARELLARGHDVRVLAPYDGGEKPDWLVPMGRTTRFLANGAESRVAVTPRALSAVRT